MKLHKSKKDNELYYYFNSKKEKLWCYRHRYYDALGKRREKSKQNFKTENEAYKALLAVKANTLNGNMKQVEYSNLSIAEWFDTWYETHKNDWKISTLLQRESAIRLQIKPLLGNYKLVKLDKSTYKRVFVNKLLESYSPASVFLFHKIFLTGINAAVDDEIIPRNRFNKISIEVSKKDDNFLTASELKEFLSHCKRLLTITSYTLILLLAHSGLRKGEALGLQWKNIDFEANTLTVEKTRDGKGVRTPKTKNSYRSILLDKETMAQLKKYKSWCKKTMLFFGKSFTEDSFVFISYQRGTPISEPLIQHAMAKVIRETGFKRITPHGLRHSHATILVASKKKIPVKTIAERLGNTPKMIYEVYGHNYDELERESVEAFEQALNS